MKSLSVVFVRLACGMAVLIAFLCVVPASFAKEFIGVVRDARLYLLNGGHERGLRLTAARAEEATAPDPGEIDLRQYDNEIINVTGELRGSTVFAARITAHMAATLVQGYQRVKDLDERIAISLRNLQLDEENKHEIAFVQDLEKMRQSKLKELEKEAQAERYKGRAPDKSRRLICCENIEKRMMGEVTVHYATTRRRSGISDLNYFYGSGRISKPASLEYGAVTVNIPTAHATGRIERPYHFFSIEMKEMLDQHVMVVEITPSSKKKFYDSVRLGLRETQNRETFVFIHGYWSSFADAARKTAQIARDLKVDMVPIMFDWASQNSFAGYFDDDQAERDAVEYLAEFLSDLEMETNANKIHLIAHSMGNDLLTQALKVLSDKDLRRRPHKFSEVVLAAPDVDAGVFLSAVTAAKKICTRITTYAASNDLAMLASHFFRRTSYRVGDSKPEPLVIEGVDTIDVSDANSDWLGHSYITSNKSVLFDVYSLLEGKLPLNRMNLKSAVTREQKTYWVFTP